MRSLIRHITRKSRGGFAVREQTAESEALVAGRGNDCAIHLPDPRVLLHHAELVLRGGDLYVNALPNADVRINGNLITGGRFALGDILQIGPYEIKREEVGSEVRSDDAAPASYDCVLAVEMVQPLGDDLIDLVERSRIHITRIGLPLRTWCWIFALAVALLLFAAPFALNLFYQAVDVHGLTALHKQPPASPTRIWTSGAISSSHKFFGVACETCHQIPFIPVRDGACLNCHDGIQQHAMGSRFPYAAFTGTSCADCHKEHRGEISITLNDQAFCISCHRTLVEKTGHTELRDASDFGTDHPQFRPTVVTDTALHLMDRSRAIGDVPPPTENNGLIFPHARHLRSAGVRDPVRGIVNLQCEDCHTPTADGFSMKTPTFEKNCHGCHQLKFDALVPDRELMHGNVQDVFKQVRDIYDAVAMRGGYSEPTAPDLVRRRPGTTLTEPQKQIVARWAATKSEAVINGRFGKGLCSDCHVLTESGGPANSAKPDPADTLPWDVKPVEMSPRYLPKAEFTHAKHRDVACSTCHSSKNSMSASDVLIPGVAVCQSCHGGEKSNDRVPSTCITCHRFHRSDLRAMHPSGTNAAETGRWDNHEEAIHKEQEEQAR
ncbi:MAG: hypothetical protein EPO08_00810 [Rhodospirillaceae bacterium]|nr:MAG: hypothetical protein EPO08_00810 [Rhodospirillaceae bacterium]